MAHYVCDECGEAFAEKRDRPPIECPKCHKKAGVILVWHECGQCKKRYQGLRYRPVPGREAEYSPKRPTELPVRQAKLRDSAWVMPDSAKGMALMKRSYLCPSCNTANPKPVDPPPPREGD